MHIAAEEVLSPASPRPNVLVAFNAPSLTKFGPSVKSGDTIVYDSSTIVDAPAPPAGVEQYGIPFTEIAVGLGKARASRCQGR